MTDDDPDDDTRVQMFEMDSSFQIRASNDEDSDFCAIVVSGPKVGDFVARLAVIYNIMHSMLMQIDMDKIKAKSKESNRVSALVNDIITVAKIQAMFGFSMKIYDNDDRMDKVTNVGVEVPRGIATEFIRISESYDNMTPQHFEFVQDIMFFEGENIRSLKGFGMMKKDKRTH